MARLKSIWLFPLLAPGACHAQSASLLTPSIQVEAISAEQSFDTYVEVKKPAAYNAPLKITCLWDVELFPLKAMAIEGPTESSSEQFWRVSWKYSGRPPSKPVVFPMLLESGTVSSFAELTLSLRPPADLTPVVRPPLANWDLANNPQTSFSIDTGMSELHVVGVSASTLVNSDTSEQLLPQDFAITTGSCQSVNWDHRVVESIGGTPATLNLCFTPKQSYIGKFAGQVWLTSREKHDFAAFQLTIFSSSTMRRLLGAGCIAAGIFLFFLVSIGIRRRVNRLAALLPAARLRDACNGLREKLGVIKATTGFDWPAQNNKDVQGTLANILDQISTSKLDKAGFLPTLFSSTQNLDPGYQVLLQRCGSQVDALTILINEGLMQVNGRWPIIVRLKQEAAGLTAMSAIAALFPVSGPTDPLRRQVLSILSNLDGQLQIAAGANAPAGGGAFRLSEPSVDQLTIQLNEYGWLMFVIWAILTEAIGCIALILMKDGFGVRPDMIRCFLWGLGVQAAGGSLQQLGPTSITNAFSLQILR
jgi:hypothetical protein